MNGHVSGGEGRNLLCVDVDANYLMAEAGETCGGGEPYIARADDRHVLGLRLHLKLRKYGVTRVGMTLLWIHEAPLEA